MPRTPSGGLSTGAKAGIGIGIGVALGTIFGIITLIYSRIYRKRSHGDYGGHAVYEIQSIGAAFEPWDTQLVNTWRMNAASRQPKPVCAQNDISESTTSSDI
jgi:hypothetical protein